MYPASPDVLSEKFTAKERDAETGLDYFDARYFSGPQGRFTSPDEPFADQSRLDPQSWNLYSYVRNNPLKYIDPTGNDCVYTNDFSSSGTVGLERGSCSQEGGQYYEGTIDKNSFTFNSGTGQLGFSYTNGDVIGSGTIGGLSGPPSDPLPPGIGPMLQAAGNRASRDTSTFMISSAIFATLFVSTYAGPALVAGGEAGVLYFGPFTRAAARFAQKYHINPNSEKSREVLFNLEMNVETFIGKFRQGSVKGEVPGEYLKMSVKEAIASGNSTIRKLLVDGRWDK